MPIPKIVSDNRRAAWLLISLSSECEMSGQPNTLQNHCDLGENRSLNQQRLLIMSLYGSTDPKRVLRASFKCSVDRARMEHRFKQTICTSMYLAIGNFELSFDPPIVSKAIRNCEERAHDSNGSRSFVAAEISLIRTSRVMYSNFFVMSCHVMSVSCIEWPR